MNWNQVAGDWKHYVGEIKARFENMADDELLVITSKHDQLASKLQPHYRYTKDKAHKGIDNFQKALPQKC